MKSETPELKTVLAGKIKMYASILQIISLLVCESKFLV